MPIRNGMSASILLAAIALALITILTLLVGFGVCLHDNFIKATPSTRLISELIRDDQRYVRLNEEVVQTSES